MVSGENNTRTTVTPLARRHTHTHTHTISIGEEQGAASWPSAPYPFRPTQPLKEHTHHHSHHHHQSHQCYTDHNNNNNGAVSRHLPRRTEEWRGSWTTSAQTRRPPSLSPSLRRPPSPPRTPSRFPAASGSSRRGPRTQGTCSRTIADKQAWHKSGTLAFRHGKATMFQRLRVKHTVLQQGMANVRIRRTPCMISSPSTNKRSKLRVREARVRFPRKVREPCKWTYGVCSLIVVRALKPVPSPTLDSADEKRLEP